MNWTLLAVAALTFSLGACAAQLTDMSDDAYCRNAAQGRSYTDCRNRVGANRNGGTIIVDKNR